MPSLPASGSKAVMMWCLRSAVVVTVWLPLAVAAQQPPPQPQQPPPESDQWAKLPKMQLERQFAGPLQDTIVQRWRDPVEGVICYIYLPITAAHSPPTTTGYVQYGANGIGTISCIEPARLPAPSSAKQPGNSH